MEEKKILLVCSAGMSTSMLVKKMKDYATKIGKHYEIEAMPMAAAKPLVDDWDVVMLAPQVSFILDDFKKAVGKGQNVLVIPSSIYALAKGKEALELAEENL